MDVKDYGGNSISCSCATEGPPVNAALKETLEAVGQLLGAAVTATNLIRATKNGEPMYEKVTFTIEVKPITNEESSGATEGCECIRCQVLRHTGIDIAADDTPASDTRGDTRGDTQH